jgi:hypothetical protein
MKKNINKSNYSLIKNLCLWIEKEINKLTPLQNKFNNLWQLFTNIKNRLNRNKLNSIKCNKGLMSWRNREIIIYV